MQEYGHLPYLIIDRFKVDEYAGFPLSTTAIFIGGVRSLHRHSLRHTLCGVHQEVEHVSSQTQSRILETQLKLSERVSLSAERRGPLRGLHAFPCSILCYARAMFLVMDRLKLGAYRLPERKRNIPPPVHMNQASKNSGLSHHRG
jgi:hypothetical protein